MCGLTLVFWVIATVYDVVTLPVYIIIQRPWARVRSRKSTWAVHMRDGDINSPMIRTTPNVASTMFHGIETVDALFRRSVEKYGNSPCFGTREVKDEAREVIHGKTMVKYSMGEYHWKTYKEVNARVDAVGNGLLALGVKPHSNIVVFAETREEWMITALACFRHCIVVCTIYATLGDEGIVHGVNETEVSVLVTSEELLARLQNLITRLPRITHIIYMSARGRSGHIPPMDGAQVLPFEALARLESSKDMTEIQNVVPTGKDPVIIMYTSGSTGQPKGVIILNSNVVSMVLACANLLLNYGPQDAVVSYLPLAHVMEVVVESVFMTLGVRIGYSSPFTLTDAGTALKPGTCGDATLLRPTIMTAVPLLLNRIRKAVEVAINEKSCVGRSLFNFADAYKTTWMRRGFTTPLINAIVFRKTKMILGGRVKLIISGSAPLAQDTRRLLINCLDCPIVEGYGLTETTAGATLQDQDDVEGSVVGPPLTGAYVKLDDWEEGGYSAKDKPNPRGEIIVGGPTVTAGYYKRPELTHEYFEEVDNIRWFRTGDIGEILPSGNIRIVDRRKDLVKLQYGEYVSLGKVESTLITNALVDNVCVYGSPLSTYTVALIQPNLTALHEIAKTFKMDEKTDLETLCSEANINKAVTHALIKHCRKAGLIKFEIPEKYKLCKESWTPENELTTAALKIRRVRLQKFYEQDIKAMYDAPKTENK